jgi:hypothetical protein
MNLFSAAQLTDSGCRVIFDADSYYVQNHRSKALTGAGSRRRDSLSLWDLFEWLCVPSAHTTTITTSSRALAASASFSQWHH